MTKREKILSICCWIGLATLCVFGLCFVIVLFMRTVLGLDSSAVRPLAHIICVASVAFIMSMFRFESFKMSKNAWLTELKHPLPKGLRRFMLGLARDGVVIMAFYGLIFWWGQIGNPDMLWELLPFTSLLLAMLFEIPMALLRWRRKDQQAPSPLRSALPSTPSASPTAPRIIAAKPSSKLDVLSKKSWDDFRKKRASELKKEAAAHAGEQPGKTVVLDESIEDAKAAQQPAPAATTAKADDAAKARAWAQKQKAMTEARTKAEFEARAAAKAKAEAEALAAMRKMEEAAAKAKAEAEAQAKAEAEAQARAEEERKLRKEILSLLTRVEGNLHPNGQALASEAGQRALFEEPCGVLPTLEGLKLDSFEAAFLFDDDPVASEAMPERMGALLKGIVEMLRESDLSTIAILWEEAEPETLVRGHRAMSIYRRISAAPTDFDDVLSGIAEIILRREDVIQWIKSEAEHGQ